MKKHQQTSVETPASACRSRCKSSCASRCQVPCVVLRTLRFQVLAWQCLAACGLTSRRVCGQIRCRWSCCRCRWSCCRCRCQRKTAGTSRHWSKFCGSFELCFMGGFIPSQHVGGHCAVVPSRLESEVQWKSSEIAATNVAESVALGMCGALASRPRMSRGEIVLSIAAAGTPSSTRMHGQLR